MLDCIQISPNSPLDSDECYNMLNARRCHVYVSIPAPCMRHSLGSCDPGIRPARRKFRFASHIPLDEKL